MHGDPHVPNDGRPGRGYPLRPGLVIAIEPWFLQSTDQIHTDPDGWTLRSADGSRGAHLEHTIAITEDGPIVLDGARLTCPSYASRMYTRLFIDGCTPRVHSTVQRP